MPKGNKKGTMSVHDMFEAAMKNAGKSAVKIHILKQKEKKRGKKHEAKVLRLNAALLLQVNQNLKINKKLDDSVRRLGIAHSSLQYYKRELGKADSKILELFDEIDFLEADAKSWEEFAFRQIDEDQLILVFPSISGSYQQSLEAAMVHYEGMKNERDQLAERLGDAYAQLSELDQENGLFSSAEVEALTDELNFLKEGNQQLYQKIDELEECLRTTKQKPTGLKPRTRRPKNT